MMIQSATNNQKEQQTTAIFTKYSNDFLMASYCVLMLQKILIDKRYLMKNVILFENPFKFYFTFTATQKHFIVGLQVVFFLLLLCYCKILSGE